MATFTIRSADERLNQELKKESRRRGVSVNRLVVETLKDALLGGDGKRRRFDDLDEFSGLWSEADAAEFDEAVRGFSEIDRELWRD